MTDKIAQIRERWAKGAKGPWMWDVNIATHTAHLTTTHSGRIFVLGFRRWGTQSAQPLFQDYERGVVEPLSKWVVPRQAHHPDFDMDIDHSDARKIASAPTDIAYLLDTIATQQRQLAEAEAHIQKITEEFANPQLLEMAVKDGKFDVGLKGGACHLLAEIFAKQFEDGGATNYLELMFTHKKLGTVTVTMQRVDGKTPGQMKQEAEARAQEAEAGAAAYRGALVESLAALQDCHPMNPDEPCYVFDTWWHGKKMLTDTPTGTALLAELHRLRDVAGAVKRHIEIDCGEGYCGVTSLDECGLCEVCAALAAMEEVKP